MKLTIEQIELLSDIQKTIEIEEEYDVVTAARCTAAIMRDFLESKGPSFFDKWTDEAVSARIDDTVDRWLPMVVITGEVPNA